MDSGAIVEQGTHEELMKNKGINFLLSKKICVILYFLKGHGKNMRYEKFYCRIRAQKKYGN